MGNPRQAKEQDGPEGEACLEQSETDAEGKEEQKGDPMAQRPSRGMGNGVSLGLTRELVPVPRDDQEITDVVANLSPIYSPKGNDGIEEQRQRLHTKVPERFISISVTLLQSSNIGELRRVLIKLYPPLKRPYSLQDKWRTHEIMYCYTRS